MINCIPYRDRFPNYGILCSIGIITLEQIKQDKIEYPDKVMKRLGEIEEFLTSSLVDESELPALAFKTTNPFTICLDAMTKAKVLNVSDSLTTAHEKLTTMINAHLVTIRRLQESLAGRNFDQKSIDAIKPLVIFLSNIQSYEDERERPYQVRLGCF